MKYRKKPVIIEAIQFNKGQQGNIFKFMQEGGVRGGSMSDKVVTIETLEGVMTAQLGDWIIKGVKGEFYPCKPDIFEATYEKVEE